MCIRDSSFTGLNRIPVLMLGPLLHLTGEAFVPMVGGDRIGGRPVNFHVQALEAFGAEVDVTDDGIRARCTRLRGAIIELPFPSVGATESALLSASMAEGKTVIRNAATEPEVLELALFLQRMGARIELSPDRRIIIEGVEKLSGAHTVSYTHLDVYKRQALTSSTTSRTPPCRAPLPCPRHRAKRAVASTGRCPSHSQSRR